MCELSPVIFLGLFNGIIIFWLVVRPLSIEVKRICGVPLEPLLLPLNPLANKFIASPYALVLFRRGKCCPMLLTPSRPISQVPLLLSDLLFYRIRPLHGQNGLNWLALHRIIASKSHWIVSHPFEKDKVPSFSLRLLSAPFPHSPPFHATWFVLRPTPQANSLR